jgi:predicted nucleotidyltransferase
MKKLSKDEILSVLRAELEQRPEILFAYLFGSFVEEEKFRDLDVAVFLQDEQLLKDWLTYMIDLSSDLQKETGCAVDVVVMNVSPNHLIHSIAKGMVLIDRDEQFRSEWIERLLSRYFDDQPTRRRSVAELFT